MSTGPAGTGVGEEGGGVIDAIGRTSIATLMALVERSSLVIGSDSACVHMAVGFDRPLVALYGPTDVAKVGPYQKEGAVVQCLRAGDRFDHKDEALGREMMGRIATEDVLRKVGEVINDAKRAKEEGVGRTPSGVDA